MFCPHCKAEYRVGFVRCADCDIELVDHISPAEPERDDVTYTIVRTVQHLLQADQLCSFLQGSGIPAQVRGERFRNPYDVSAVFGDLHIIVPDDFADRAVDLLEKADRGELEIDADDVSF